MLFYFKLKFYFILDHIKDFDYESDSDNLLVKYKERATSSDNLRINGLTKKLLEKILKLIRQSIELLDKNREKKECSKVIVDEWKEVATRVDHILFFIATATIILSPIILFHKFFFRTQPVYFGCGCDS